MSEDTRAVVEKLWNAAEAASEGGDSTSPAPEAASESAAEVDATPAPEAAESSAAKAARARDEAGRFAPAQKAEATPKPAPGKVSPTPKPGPAETTPAAPPAPGTPSATPVPAYMEKPPASWKPEAGGKWGALPPEVRAEAHRLDREVRATMQRAAETEKTWKATLQPFEPLLRAEAASRGAPYNPAAAVGGLLQTAHALQYGDKEAVTAQIIKGYGVNVDRLAELLNGLPGQQGQPPPPPQFRDPRVDGLLSTLQQTAEQQARARAEEFKAKMEDFSSTHEHFEKVRESMADLMEKGLTTDLEELYDLACYRDPQLRKARERVRELEAANVQAASTARALTAASSVRSEAAVPVPAAKPRNTREEVQAQWEAAEARGRGR